MWRIVHGAALVAGTALAVTGCGERQPASPVTPEARMTAAVLSQQDMPAGYLPAEDQPVFGGLRPGDPDCRQLLALAEARGLRDVPRAGAVFYRADPGASLAQHVVRLPPTGAARHIAESRQAARDCPKIKVEMGPQVMRLHRTALRAPAAQDAFAVRYSGAGGAHFDIAMARVGDDLLVLAHPGVVSGGGDRVTERVAARALRKLRAVPGALGPAPDH